MGMSGETIMAERIEALMGAVGDCVKLRFTNDVGVLVVVWDDVDGQMLLSVGSIGIADGMMAVALRHALKVAEYEKPLATTHMVR